MSRDYPDSVDPWKAAEGQRRFEGTVPISRMHRLESLLAPMDEGEQEVPGEAAFAASFSFDREGYVTIDITVKASLPLVCQRSLQRFVAEFERQSTLAVIENVEDEDAVPQHYEPVLVEERRLAIVELVEEELLLAVPQVPIDPESSDPELPEGVGMKASSGEETEPTHRPFEGLAGLMKTRTDD